MNVATPETNPARAAIEQLLDAVGERDARHIVSEIGRRASQLELERIIVLRLAVRLLEERAPRSTIRDRLVSRGLHWRSAYRVIDCALGLGPRDSVINPLPLTKDFETMDQQQQTEVHMAQLTEADLKAKLQGLKENLARVEGTIAAARSDQSAALEKHAHMKAKRAEEHEAHRGGFYTHSIDEMQAVAHAATAANRRAGTADMEATQLRREIADLQPLLDGEQRVAQATELLASVTEMVAKAEDQVKDAESALKTIDGLITAESKAYESARSGAAAQLLALVKSKGDVSKVAAVSREKVGTMEMAKASAQSELEAARAALTAAKSSQAATRKALYVAQADVTGLAHTLAFDAYVSALATHMNAYSRAHNSGFWPEAPADKARQRAEGLLEKS